MFQFSDHDNDAERSFKPYRDGKDMDINQSIVPMIHPERVQIHCQKIAYQLINPNGKAENEYDFHNSKKAKLLRKVKLKCVKKKKQAYLRNIDPKKYSSGPNMVKPLGQMSTRRTTNRRSYNSRNNGRKLRGICK